MIRCCEELLRSLNEGKEIAHHFLTRLQFRFKLLFFRLQDVNPRLKTVHFLGV